MDLKWDVESLWAQREGKACWGNLGGTEDSSTYTGKTLPPSGDSYAVGYKSILSSASKLIYLNS